MHDDPTRVMGQGPHEPGGGRPHGNMRLLVAGLVLTESRPEVLTLGIFVAAFVIFAHRGNVRRILRGEEYRFGAGSAAAAAPGETRKRK